MASTIVIHLTTMTINRKSQPYTFNCQMWYNEKKNYITWKQQYEIFGM